MLAIFSAAIIVPVKKIFWKSNRDPLKILANWLLEQQYATADVLAQIEQEVQAEIEAGEQFALSAPYPPESEVDKHVYA